MISTAFFSKEKNGRIVTSTIATIEVGVYMNTVFQKGQSMFSKYVVFFFTAVIFLWIKTYIVQLTQFNLGVENALQEFLLFLNPLGSSILFLGLAGFLKGGKNTLG